MIGTANKALRLFSAGAPIQAALLFALIFAAALLEMLSIGLVIPLLQVVFVEGEASRIEQVVRCFLPTGRAPDTALVVAAVFSGVFVFKTVAILALTYLINWTVLRKSAEAQGRLFRAYLDRPLSFHVRTNSAELLRNIMSGCGQSFEATRQVFMIGLELVLSVATLLLLFLVEPVMTATICAILVPGAALFYFGTAGRFRFWGEKSMEIEADEIRWINQALGSIRFAKIFGATGALTGKLFGLARVRAGYDARASTALHMPRLFLETLVIIGFIGMVGVALAKGHPAEELTATLGVFAMASLRLLPSVNRLLSAAAELRRRSPYIDTVFEDLVAIPASAPPPSATAASPIDFEDRLDVENATLVYEGAETAALDRVSLTVGRGESVGIVGASGAGKSSLVDTIIGLTELESGRVLVDGRDIGENRESWQRLIGYVPQETYLLDDTLRRNIAFTLADESISDDRVRESVAMAHLGGLVALLPAGLDTVLGERGARLSGGQRQRIAIARALYRDPEVLVFDEATAALDNESETEITQAIRALAGDKTIFIIAHRLSTVRGCDRIVYMQGGRIRDTGPFDELYRRCGEFRTLVDLGNSKPVAEERERV
jgi:ABC-type multidrug transport system fused ATPase/permease subunit